MVNLRREISERNVGNEIQGRENMGLQGMETLKRNKGEGQLNGGEEQGRAMYERIKRRKGGKKDLGR